MTEHNSNRRVAHEGDGNDQHYGQATGLVFVTTWRGKPVKLRLLSYGNDLVPEGFLDRDVEVVGRWMDYMLATVLRRQGTRVASPNLIMAGTVMQNSCASNESF
jgi:hypothetical protein